MRLNQSARDIIMHPVAQVACVVIGAYLLRLIPELRFGPTPIGYDTSNPYLSAFAHYDGGFFESVQSSNLLYWIFASARAMGADGIAFIKSGSPFIYAGYCLSFYCLCRKAMKLSHGTALLALLLFVLQLSTLRLSWDLLRNQAGLICGFWTIIWAVEWNDDKRPLRLAKAGLGVVLTLGFHQLATFALAELGALMLATRAIAAFVPEARRGRATVALYLFLAIGWPLLAQTITVRSVSLWSHAPLPLQPNERLLPLQLLFILFSPVFLALAGIGAARLRATLVLPMSFLLLVQSLATVVTVGQGFFLWDRWMYLLGIPFCICAAYGMEAVGARAVPAWARPVAAIALALWLSYPSLAFLDPDKTLYPLKVEPRLFSVIPATIAANAFIANPFEREQSENLVACLRQLEPMHDGSATIERPPKYAGLFDLVTPSLSRYVSNGPQPETLGQRSDRFVFSYDVPGDLRMFAPVGQERCPIQIPR